MAAALIGMFHARYGSGLGLVPSIVKNMIM